MHFPSADQYKSLLIFNIRHNRCGLVIKVDFRAKLLMVKEFLTHDESMRGSLKQADLLPIFKSRGYVSDVVNAKRAISKGHAKQLAEFFHVPVSVFI